MRNNEKNGIVNSGLNQVFGIDFHDFIQREQSNTMVELASEFGLQVREVKSLKKQLGRS
ncbi:hypothetical protein IEO70_05795 [Bacillus sp. AGMB 02131]|uniref:RNA polymerase subunit sigma-70 n=1 Tax=Peribacillus faecalis TaxID=2772559 RepID=A0A927HAF4_9BACI|nr:hypothetical protein [Peribacillus faecalis]MBD3107874.1 hypothetical protein [Peribacillus faecalis]